MGFFASEGCMRLRLHVDAIAVVVFCYRAVAVQAAFIASFMHLNNLKPQDDTSSVSFGQTDRGKWACRAPEMQIMLCVK